MFVQKNVHSGSSWETKTNIWMPPMSQALVRCFHLSHEIFVRNGENSILKPCEK